jgi:hypothetical protein
LCGDVMRGLVCSGMWRVGRKCEEVVLMRD